MGGIGLQLVRWGRPVVTICFAGRWQCAIQVVPDPEREEAEGMVDLEPAEPADPDGNGWLVPSWVASVRTTAHRLGGELQRTGQHEPLAEAASQQAVKKAIERALTRAQRPGLVCHGPFKLLRQLGRRLADWWTGGDVDQAWAELHTASQVLLTIEAPAVVKAQLADMAATVVTALDPSDVRVPDYLKTLELLAPACRDIRSADRAQLRAIRQACDSSADGGHADARAFRNMLILVGSLLGVVLAILAIIAWADKDFRSIFAAARTHPSGWYVFELELIASLSGLTGAVLSLRNYTGFQYSYGLPFVQAVLKGSAGAATGLFGVLLARSGIAGSLTLQPGAGTFAVAVVFGYAQYLFTRLVDQQANAVLKSAGSRSDPSITPRVPPGAPAPALLTTDTARCPQVSGVSPKEGPSAGGTSVVLRGSGFTTVATVSFGSKIAEDVTVNSDTQITVKSPPGNGTVTITVMTPVGISWPSAATQFTYSPAQAEGTRESGRRTRAQDRLPDRGAQPQ
jgi:hypothetical protein